jgi:hypothetical protein
MIIITNATEVRDLDPREAIAALPLTVFQLTVIGVLFCLNALDGFDVLAISFAAPEISRDWGISPAALADDPFSIAGPHSERQR